MIDKVMIEKLRSLPIEQVADALGMGLRWHNAICPFHNDSHPSLHFSTSHNTYHCYVCGKYGGTIDLVMHRMNLNFMMPAAGLHRHSDSILRMTEEQATVAADMKTLLADSQM